jgi:carbonic anhydrase
LNPFRYDEILPKNYWDNLAYFHYHGSLTTPPCTETVSWFVMEETIKVSRKQIDSTFHNITDPGRQSTFRPTQSLSGRKVYYFPGGRHLGNHGKPKRST